MTAIAANYLTEQINEQLAQVRTKVPADILATMVQATADLEQQRLADHALKVGDRLPDFQLPDATGQTIKLSELLKNGPVVISFYRGGWCPYCNLELRALQQALPKFAQYNAQLVAISPETPDNSLTTQEKNDLSFPVLSDVDNVVAKQFGLVFALAAALRPIYQQFGLDIAAYNGNDKYELPMPATYVVDTTGMIRYAFIEADYLKRAEPTDIIANLAQL